MELDLLVSIKITSFGSALNSYLINAVCGWLP